MRLTSVVRRAPLRGLGEVGVRHADETVDSVCTVAGDTEASTTVVALAVRRPARSKIPGSSHFGSPSHVDAWTITSATASLNGVWRSSRVDERSMSTSCTFRRCVATAAEAPGKSSFIRDAHSIEAACMVRYEAHHFSRVTRSDSGVRPANDVCPISVSRAAARPSIRPAASCDDVSRELRLSCRSVSQTAHAVTRPPMMPPRTPSLAMAHHHDGSFRCPPDQVSSMARTVSALYGRICRVTGDWKVIRRFFFSTNWSGSVIHATENDESDPSASSASLRLSSHSPRRPSVAPDSWSRILSSTLAASGSSSEMPAQRSNEAAWMSRTCDAQLRKSPRSTSSGIAEATSCASTVAISPNRAAEACSRCNRADLFSCRSVAQTAAPVAAPPTTPPNNPSSTTPHHVSPGFMTRTVQSGTGT
ncbi:hypothetical protein SAMN05421872_102326 [Nocardioides lianchengensis]|uniref:Uncharacterized protein n=1 Tax=Nocardioides lianchengensis TaxID=1045774 RepID=A0A1G6LQJ9_9ACTN|nr:hypothetical protein SAMN05421872_102326 [Nocardioides lianchengensis]